MAKPKVFVLTDDQATVAAVRSAINNICKIILRDHMNHCVIDAVQKGDTETLSELDKAIDLLMK